MRCGTRRRLMMCQLTMEGRHLIKCSLWSLHLTQFSLRDYLQGHRELHGMHKYDKIDNNFDNKNEEWSHIRMGKNAGAQ
ncbi:hypothetical protein POVCU2_0018150 [Plasmodium ovale curtisi]|uniref:Uncharacterized protein n=1 Tax=Plasmodium ovale curtisi TaxID=864141 RepID=A0A1A8VVV6_PLAOA|nr:hypothetical protein POVCU2_0018150 [Plasmodium ovale curtisi]